MNFTEFAKSRFSVRSYLDKPVEEEKMMRILEAGRIAPTACNNQPQRVYAISSKKLIDQMTEVCPCTFHAPLVFVIAYDSTRDWNNPLNPGYESGETDAAIVTTHMMLQATEEGLGSCWVGWFDPNQIAKILELPSEIHVSALLPVGYSKEDVVPTENHTKIRDFEDTITILR